MARMTRTREGRRTLGIIGALGLIVALAVPITLLSGGSATAQQEFPDICIQDDAGAEGLNECCDLQSLSTDDLLGDPCCYEFDVNSDGLLGDPCCDELRVTSDGLLGDACCNEEVLLRGANELVERRDPCEPPELLCELLGPIGDCPGEIPTPTEEPTPEQESTPTPTPTPEPTEEPTPDPTPEPTPDPTPGPDVAGGGIGFTG